MAMQLEALIQEVHELREEKHVLAKREQEIRKRLEDLEGEIRALLDVSGELVGDLEEQDFQTLLANLSDDRTIRVEVVYARRGETFLRELQLSRGASIQDVLEVSGVMQEIPEIDLNTCKVGVHGRVMSLDYILRDSDRVEIYRPIETGKKNTSRQPNRSP